MRWKSAVPAVVAMALTSIATATVGGAEPTRPPSCTFTLSPPQRVSVSGTDMVTATVAVKGCDGLAAPASSVVCVSADGSDSGQQCAEGKGLLPAQVFFTPYRAGTTYVSSGRGCANISTPPSWSCQPIAGRSAVL